MLRFVGAPPPPHTHTRVTRRVPGQVAVDVHVSTAIVRLEAAFAPPAGAPPVRYAVLEVPTSRGAAAVTSARVGVPGGGGVSTVVQV